MTQKENLKTKRGQEAAIRKLENQCKAAMVKAGIGLSKDALVAFAGERSVEIGIVDKTKKRYLAWASELRLYPQSKSIGGDIREAHIGFGTTGSFNPSNDAAYWRTVHAAEILKNWDVAISIVSRYLKQYSELLDKIYKK